MSVYLIEEEEEGKNEIIISDDLIDHKLQMIHAIEFFKCLREDKKKGFHQRIQQCTKVYSLIYSIDFFFFI